MSEGELDLSLGPTGVSARTKGYRLMDLAWGASVVGIVYIAVMVSTHDAAAGKGTDATVKAQEKVAAKLEETNKETLSVLREIARATRESNCINSFPENQRTGKAELCKRVSQ